MAANVEKRPTESERGITRRPEYYSDLFSAGPFGLMRRFSEEMDRMFAHTLSNFRSGTWSPDIEVRERNGNLEVTAELPGLTKDDVKVQCTEDRIIIEGEKRQEHEESKEGFHRTERSYGKFSRTIPLPQGTETDKAKAEFKDGVLKLTVPIPDSKQRRRDIPIAA